MEDGVGNDDDKFDPAVSRTLADVTEMTEKSGGGPSAKLTDGKARPAQYNEDMQRLGFSVGD